MHNLYTARRRRLMGGLAANSVVLLSAALQKLRNGDSYYPYRQQSDFYYLSGLNEPEAMIVLIPGRPEGEFILLVRERDPARTQWEGAVASFAQLKTEFGADQVFAITELPKLLSELLLNKQCIYYLFSEQNLGLQLSECLNALNEAIRRGITATAELIDLAKLLHEQRLIKDEAEIDLMRRAAAISAAAHTKAMQVCQPGMKEYELQAVLEYEFTRGGCHAVAYPSIVAGGSNACTLHYHANQAELENGDLVLVDAGGEYRNYAADITRTYPVNGQFSAEQRAIYELVLKVQEKVIASIRPGVKRDVMQLLSEREITQGLIELGLLKGDLNQLLETRAFSAFYMHGIGHWLGLDVHDVGAYKIDNEWRELKAGMVLTIEPGIYIAADASQVAAHWRGIGVRIEDDILITADGCDVLSAAAPKAIVDIEKLMSRRMQN